MTLTVNGKMGSLMEKVISYTPMEVLIRDRSSKEYPADKVGSSAHKDGTTKVSSSRNRLKVRESSPSRRSATAIKANGKEIYQTAKAVKSGLALDLSLLMRGSSWQEKNMEGVSIKAATNGNMKGNSPIMS